jgi:hypothetical protein
MNNLQITKAITDIRPKAVWALTGDSYEGLEWLDTKQSKPTLAEIENAITNPLPEPELTVAEKLASVGLSVDDLKAALGLA